MEAEEIEGLIDELEQRVERLRALYDQYFMGIEKIEPGVLRKDVDRRVWVLRREQIRNTGMRFKFNTVVQRYNTYQQYWMRICREIENGTYKRDLRRAAKKFGTEALTIQAKKRLGKQLQRELEESQEQASAQEQSDSMDIDVDVDMGDAPPQAPGALPRKKAPVHVVSLDALDNLEDILGLATTESRPQQAAARSSAHSFGNIDDIFGGPDDTDETRPHQRSALPSPAPATPPRPSSQPLPVRRPPASPSPRPPAPPAASTSSSGLGLTRKAPAASPGTAASPPQRPQPPAPPMTSVRPAARSDQALSDARMREIYSRYVQAKRECRESTSGITEDGLSRSLRATVEKLQATHKGRQIDFDVVIKDGKAVLKPVVKG